MSGALLGVLFTVGGTIGLVMIGAALAGGLASVWRLAYIPGVLVGIGATVLAILARATWECDRFGGPGRECVMLDLTAWVIAFGATAVAGLALTLLAVRRQGSRPDAWRSARSGAGSAGDAAITDQSAT